MRRHAMQETCFGFRIEGNAAVQSGTYEPDETQTILGYLGEVDVFVDVGANIGYFVCLARAHDKHVVAVEPLQQNLDVLYRNLLANGYTDVEVFPLGLSGRADIVELYGGGTGASMIDRWAGTSGVLRRAVATSTLDTLLGGRFDGKRLLIKMDVEGAEYQVLEGATAMLAAVPGPVWLLEICLTEHHPAGVNPHFADVFERFWSHGYRARTAGEQSRPVQRADVERWVRERRRDFGYVSYVFERPRQAGV